MLTDEIIKALEEKGYRVAEKGELSLYLFRILSADGQAARNDEVAKCQKIKNELGINPGVEIVPTKFI